MRARPACRGGAAGVQRRAPACSCRRSAALERSAPSAWARAGGPPACLVARSRARPLRANCFVGRKLTVRLGRGGCAPAGPAAQRMPLDGREPSLVAAHHHRTCGRRLPCPGPRERGHRSGRGPPRCPALRNIAARWPSRDGEKRARQVPACLALRHPQTRLPTPGAIFLAADPCCLAAAVNRPVMQVAHTHT